MANGNGKLRYPITPELFERLVSSVNFVKKVLSQELLIESNARLKNNLTNFEDSLNEGDGYQIHRTIAKNLFNALGSFQNQREDSNSVVNLAVANLKADLQKAIEHTRTQNIDPQTDEQQKKIEQAEISLQTTLNELKMAQQHLANLDSELEQRVMERSQRLFEEAQRAIQNRVDDGNENIRSILQSVRDELDIRASRAEDNIKQIVNKAENQSKNHRSDISELFQILEEESTNRIQVRIQKAEAIATDLTKKVGESQQEIEDLISIQKSDLKLFTQETRNEIVNSIDNASSNGMMALQKAQSSALSSIDEKVTQNIGAINKRIDTEVQAFETKRIDMDKLLEKVGLAKDADVTITQANAEEKTANELRTRGLIAMYCSILVLVLLFSEYLGLALWNDTPPKSLSDLTLEAFTIRFMTVLLISSPAVYMLKESAVHRAKENLYRQRGTQLLTIRGYLSDLPDKERTEVKQDLAKNFFSFHNGKTDTSNVPDFIRDMKEAVGIAKSLNGQTKTVSQRFGRKPK
ncbi:hypothetical protein QWY97_06670 [Vibrio cortegadensis]|uniref:hypothetical protein n=1 Tax=Vibrio cortegadensis TaxID=1328770 RepID=UPI0021C49E28|nr:hypothetical protein [Vibrio cortegadensis]MDN3697033.1 hypothetical protein [Vibrio cortegadensis]